MLFVGIHTQTLSILHLRLGNMKIVVLLLGKQTDFINLEFLNDHELMFIVDMEYVSASTLRDLSLRGTVIRHQSMGTSRHNKGEQHLIE